jgi:pseudaminic acid biosynthesis-associated methylase
MKNKNSVSRKIIDTQQLRQWCGDFGDDYVSRNSFEDWKLEPGKEAFRRILKKIEINSIMEIGCNIGLNLIFLSDLYKKNIDLYAVEPNKKAFSILTSDSRIRLKNAWNTSVFELPVPDEYVDLVFTSGVLIHIAPADLGAATDEIVRVSKKYILCIEYFSHIPESIRYYDMENLLFKRDFGSFYLDRYLNLECIDYGFLWQRELKIFDNLTYWLIEKRF